MTQVACFPDTSPVRMLIEIKSNGQDDGYYSSGLNMSKHLACSSHFHKNKFSIMKKTIPQNE